MEVIKELENKKIKEINEMIYEVLNDIRLNAESFDERKLEHITFLLTDKIYEKMME